MDLSINLAKINNQLSSQGSKLRIERRGNLLNLRGPLPCKQNSELSRVQRLSLRINANEEGLNQVFKILESVEFQVKNGQFSWEHWSQHKRSITSQKIGNDVLKAIERFKSDFFSNPIRKRSAAGTNTTWSSAYLPYLNRLVSLEVSQNCELDANLFLTTLLSYSENSRSRQQCSTALAAFARYLNLELPEDWRSIGNGYGLHQARFRSLPSDNLIKETWHQIPNPKWKLAYGLMATYGLRNHEVFFCDLSCFCNGGDKILRVLPNTKTGEHQVWPFHPSWHELFELDKLGKNSHALPLINTDLKKTTLQKIGRRVSEQFRRYQLPFTPYDLRHAWAVRTIHIGLPDTVSARMMGHSVGIHNRTYHHWITKRDQQQAVDSALAKIGS